jgi:hypothetical protein
MILYFYVGAIESVSGFAYLPAQGFSAYELDLQSLCHALNLHGLLAPDGEQWMRASSYKDPVYR